MRAASAASQQVLKSQHQLVCLPEIKMPNACASDSQHIWIVPTMCPGIRRVSSNANLMSKTMDGNASCTKLCCNVIDRCLGGAPCVHGLGPGLLMRQELDCERSLSV